MDITIQNAILDLILSIKENDLEQTIEAINILNNSEQQLQDAGYTYLDSVLSLNNMFVQYNNPALLYTLDNLKFLFSADTLKWNLKIVSLLKEKNKEKIINFVNEVLEDSNTENIINSNKFYGLIQLVTSIQDYDLIYKLKNYISKEKFDGSDL